MSAALDLMRREFVLTLCKSSIETQYTSIERNNTLSTTSFDRDVLQFCAKA